MYHINNPNKIIGEGHSKSFESTEWDIKETSILTHKPHTLSIFELFLLHLLKNIQGGD